MPDKPIGTRGLKHANFGRNFGRRRSPRKSPTAKKAAKATRQVNDDRARSLVKARAQRTENLKAKKEGREPKKVRGPKK